MQNYNIAALVHASLNGDRNAFTHLYEMTSKKAYFVALNVLKNEKIATDVIQSSYIMAYQRLPKLKYPEKFANWFNRIVSKNIYDELKKSNGLLFNIMKDDLSLAFHGEVQSIDAQLNDVSFSDNMKLKILETLDKLSLDEKLCFLMYYYFEMGVEEISKVLEVNEKFITSLLNTSKIIVKEEIVQILKIDPAMKDYAPMVFFNKALLSCSSHVPFKATDNILGNIFRTTPLEREFPTPPRPQPTPPTQPQSPRQVNNIQNNDSESTQMYSSQEMDKILKNQAADFTPYGSEYSKGGYDTESASERKMSQSAQNAIKIAIAVIVTLVFVVALFALAKDMLNGSEETSTLPMRTTTEKNSFYQGSVAQRTTEQIWTTQPETTTEATTTEEYTTEEPVTELTTEPTTGLATNEPVAEPYPENTELGSSSYEPEMQD